MTDTDIKEEEDKEQQFYAEEDSDNDSDFEVKYEQKADTFQDLQPIGKPLYLSDLIMSLQSDTFDKFKIGIESAEELIRNQSLVDLEVQASELLTLLFRVQNKFSIDDFSLRKYKSIQALVERQPK